MISFIILALFVFAGWLIWPDLSREIDAMAARGLQRIDDEDERRRRSL